MSEALYKALLRRSELLAEVAAIDRWVAQYRRFAAGTDQPLDNRVRARALGVDPRKIAEAAVEIVRQSDRPLRRKDILDALVARGFVVAAKDPVGYIGTQLWRFAKDRVRAVNGNGFVPVVAAQDTKKTAPERTEAA